MKNYKYLFLLHHDRIVDYDDTDLPIVDRKDLGIFSTKAKANDAINYFTKLKGFSLYPDSFYIEKMRIYLNNAGQNIPQTFYLLMHEYEDVSNNCDIVKRIGLYINYAEVQNKIDILLKQTPYYKFPENFQICEYNLNQESIYWKEGFDVEG